MILLTLIMSMALFVTYFLLLVKIVISDMGVSEFTREESTSYECGFEQHSLSRIPLSIRYFMLTLVFLLFDLEIMLLVFVPSNCALGVNSTMLISVSMSFILILVAGLLYEWKSKSLDWVM